MPTSTNEVSTAVDLKNQLEFSSYSFTGNDDTVTVGHIVSKSTIIFRPPICTTNRLLDVGGVSATLVTGNRVFLIRDFICPDEGALSFDEPINVVATPLSTKPLFLTMTHSLIFEPNVPFATNLQITVFAWDANGAVAPNIAFHWRCRVRCNPVFF